MKERNEFEPQALNSFPSPIRCRFCDETMNANRKRILLGGGLIAFGIAFLMYQGLQGASVYYLTVEEFLAQADGQTRQGVRIAGTVAPGTIRRAENARSVTFETQGATGAARLAVFYAGAVPDMLRDGASVVLEGKYDRAAKTFHAVTLMASCPSKYEAKLTPSPR